MPFDYDQLTWVDDSGDGSSGTEVTAARMNKFDQTLARLALRSDLVIPVDAATVAALPTNTKTGEAGLTHLTASANGAFPAQDGVTFSVGDELLLVKDEVDTSKHGIYQLAVLGDGSTPWSLQRVSDFFDEGELQGG